MKISIFSLFRDSEPELEKTLSMLDSAEKATNADIEYFFYENDSSDNTASILEDWSKLKTARISSENFKAKKFGSTLDPDRMIHMSKIRNKMLDLGKDSDSDYSVIFDSDVKFYPNILNDFLKFKDLNFSMLTPNVRQNVPCKMGSNSKTSYYDSSILFDSNLINCMTWSDNPFYEQEDRDNFISGKPIKVHRAFGGFAFLKSKPLFNCSWDSKGESEHFSLCDSLRRHGDIYLLPSIKVSVNVDQKEWDHEHLVVKKQKQLLEDPWNRFLWKTGSLSLV